MEITIARQVDVRSNIKKFFDMAYEGEALLVPRKENKNVVIISEKEYKELWISIKIFDISKAIFKKVRTGNGFVKYLLREILSSYVKASI